MALEVQGQLHGSAWTFFRSSNPNVHSGHEQTSHDKNAKCFFREPQDAEARRLATVVHERAGGGGGGKECFKTNLHVERLIKPEKTYQQAMMVSDAILKCLLKEKKEKKPVTSGSMKFNETVSCGDLIEKLLVIYACHLF